MPAIAESTVELTDYLRARDALLCLQKQLEQLALRGDVLDPAELEPNQLDQVVATLCHQARVAQQLASAAESLCAALVEGSDYRPC
jgi:hypothetical protein